jgi:hypothetical protein
MRLASASIPMKSEPSWAGSVRVLMFALLMLAFATSAVMAQDRSGAKASPQEPRVALVIGNSDYRSAPLDNPANDASDLAAALEKQGFNVLVRENVGERGLKEAVDVFAKHLKKGGIGLFFFAGHGVQLKDQNFLLPVDVGFESEADVSFKSVSAEYVLSRMAEAGNRINIVILDACRNNPLQLSRKTINKGLGVMNVGVPKREPSSPMRLRLDLPPPTAPGEMVSTPSICCVRWKLRIRTSIRFLVGYAQGLCRTPTANRFPGPQVR